MAVLNAKQQLASHQPGSGVNSLKELSWETTGMEQQLRERFTQFGDQFSSLRSRLPAKVNELIDRTRDYAKSNPLTFLTILALVLSCSLPILIFLGFATATVTVTFIGFLFVEGTILTFAGVVLTSTLLLVGFFTLTITALLFLTYFVLNTLYRFVTGSPLTETNPIKSIGHYLSMAKQNGVHHNQNHVIPLTNHINEQTIEDEVEAELAQAE